MTKYIHRFSNVSSYNAARASEYIEPWVSAIDDGPVNYNKSEDENGGRSIGE